MFQNYKNTALHQKPNIHDQHKHPTSSARRSPRLGIKNCLFSIINTAGFAIPTHPAFYYQHGRFCTTSPSCFLLSTWQVLHHQPILLSIINMAGFAIPTHPAQESAINIVLMNLSALANHYYCVK
jgi:hypothetical protein